jgi:hypothetical protein
VGLIVVFGGAALLGLLMFAGAGSRLAELRRLVDIWGWKIEKTYTNGSRGYVVVRISDLVVTVALTKERHVGWTVRVDLPPPGAPIFDIRPSIVGALVGNRIQLPYGVTAHTREPEDTRALLTQERCHMLRGQLQDAEVRCDREAMIIVEPAHVAPALIPAAVAFAIELAAADRYGLDVLRALPGAVFRAPTAKRGAGVELAGPSPIRVEPVRRGELVVTRALIEQGVLPDPRPDLSALGPATLEHDRTGAVTVTWPAIERDPARLTAAIELLRAVGGAPHDGAYR